MIMASADQKHLIPSVCTFLALRLRYLFQVIVNVAYSGLGSSGKRVRCLVFCGMPQKSLSIKAQLEAGLRSLELSGLDQSQLPNCRTNCEFEGCYHSPMMILLNATVSFLCVFNNGINIKSSILPTPQYTFWNSKVS